MDTLNHISKDMIPFFALAQDASVGALLCLSTGEKNKAVLSATPAILPILICMIDQGTNFGR